MSLKDRGWLNASSDHFQLIVGGVEPDTEKARMNASPVERDGYCFDRKDELWG